MPWQNFLLVGFMIDTKLFAKFYVLDLCHSLLATLLQNNQIMWAGVDT